MSQCHDHLCLVIADSVCNMRAWWSTVLPQQKILRGDARESVLYGIKLCRHCAEACFWTGANNSSWPKLKTLDVGLTILG